MKVLSPFSVRELKISDIGAITDYWLHSDAAFLTGIGVDLTKLPARDEWVAMLTAQTMAPIEEKQSYCMIWEINGQPVGHSNVNKIVFGKEAYMHLHLWHSQERQHGFGTALVKLTLPYFFERLQLRTLYCEPYALNPAPNRTLEKLGFTFEKKYITTPGWINFEQPVNRWKLAYEDIWK